MKRRYYVIIIVGLTLIGSILVFTFSKNRTYTVTLDIDGGKLLNNISIKRGYTIENIDKPIRDGYIFVSWLLNGIPFDEDTPITEDITLEAKWIPEPDIVKKYKITFDIDGEIKTQSVEEGKTVDKPKNPTKVNYKFVGWYKNGEEYDFDTSVNSNITLKAVFEEKMAKIVFDLDGGSGLREESMVRGEKLDKPKEPTKFGYKFVKWTLNGEEYNFDTIVTNDMTLKAVWIATEYVKVKFDTDGGTEIKPQTIEKGTKLKSVDNPVKEGYTFKYWSLNGVEFDINGNIDDNYTLVAVYEETVG